MTRLKWPSGHWRSTGIVIAEHSGNNIAAIDKWYNCHLNAQNLGLLSYPHSPELLVSVCQYE